MTPIGRRGSDYPITYVRWTEKRNFEAVRDMMYIREVDVKPLISHGFTIEDSVRALDLFSPAESRPVRTMGEVALWLGLVQLGQ